MGAVWASDDVPVRPLTPEVDWGLEPYTERLAVYSPVPLAVRLLVIAGEFDGRVWTRLSEDAALQETYGAHFDLVTNRINELAGRLRSWLSGDASLGARERRAFAPSGKVETSPAGSSKPESQQSPARDREGEALAPMSNKEIPAPTMGVARDESFSRRLRRLIDYARR